MTSANTFGTFLDTVRKLESGRTTQTSSGWPEKEVFLIAKTLLSDNGRQPLKVTMSTSGLPQEVFLGALIAGQDKGLFKVDEETEEPVLTLTKLGRVLVS
jgi:hypothetical protein